MIKNILLYIHQLPQNILGYILSRSAMITLYVPCKDNRIQEVYFSDKVFKSGVSLGKYVILDYDKYYSLVATRKARALNIIWHEHGHSMQSLRLGWLYLLVIGLPSLTGNIAQRIFKFSNKKYYSLPWEVWADKLGKVERNFY